MTRSYSATTHLSADVCCAVRADQVLAKVRSPFVAHLDRANDLQSTLSK
jgi:hypothetical protein